MNSCCSVLLCGRDGGANLDSHRGKCRVCECYVRISLGVFRALLVNIQVPFSKKKTLNHLPQMSANLKVPPCIIISKDLEWKTLVLLACFLQTSVKD